eukprot:scaffold627168_cov19-Prasinocladus_malaysianus.AAC.1
MGACQFDFGSTIQIIGHPRIALNALGLGEWDGLAALTALVSMAPGIPSEERSLYQADASRIMFTGHSMGGNSLASFPSRCHACGRESGRCTARNWKMSCHQLNAHNVYSCENGRMYPQGMGA